MAKDFGKLRRDQTIYDQGTFEGYPYVVVQGPFSINGYVAVPVSHPDWGKEYDDVEMEVHGGLTFGCMNQLTNPWVGFEDYVGWWIFGFDTSHYMDDDGSWTVEAVINETHKMCLQFAGNKHQAEGGKK